MSLPSLFDYAPEVILKLGEAEAPERPSRAAAVGRAAGTVGAGLLGLTGGTLLGYGAGRLAEHLHGGPLPAQVIAPLSGLAGAGLGMTYGLYQAQQKKELRRVLESQRDRPPGSVSEK